jgi:hypothetical protein
MNFPSMLERFGAAVARRDTAAFTAMFAPDGVYDDAFFGPHGGREAIGAMLERFYVGGEDFCWEFTEPAHTGEAAYASYCFSYRSREPESRGQLMAFEGVSRFRLRDGLIAHYSETIDRGGAFLRLGYADARVLKLLGRYSRQFVEGPVMQRHLAYREAQAAARAR